MSTIGFAARPGTDVDPTWSIRRAAAPSAPRIRCDSSSNDVGHDGSGSSSRSRGSSQPSPVAGSRSPQVPEQCERVEERLLGGVALRGVLRMPLHPDHPGLRVVQRSVELDRLDQSVRGTTRRHEALADTIDPLVVVRRGHEARGLRGREQAAALRDRDVVQRLRVQDGHAMLEHPVEVGQMRMERSPERDVHDLHAAADAEGRQTAFAPPRAAARSPSRPDRARRRRCARRRAGRRTARDRRRRRRRGAARRRARAVPPDRPSSPGERIAVRAPARRSASRYGAGTP